MPAIGPRPGAHTAPAAAHWPTDTLKVSWAGEPRLGFQQRAGRRAGCQAPRQAGEDHGGGGNPSGGNLPWSAVVTILMVVGSTCFVSWSVQQAMTRCVQALEQGMMEGAQVLSRGIVEGALVLSQGIVEGTQVLSQGFAEGARVHGTMLEEGVMKAARVRSTITEELITDGTRVHSRNTEEGTTEADTVHGRDGTVIEDGMVKGAQPDSQPGHGGGRSGHLLATDDSGCVRCRGCCPHVVP